jgi:hypothetical protein
MRIISLMQMCALKKELVICRFGFRWCESGYVLHHHTRRKAQWPRPRGVPARSAGVYRRISDKSDRRFVAVEHRPTRRAQARGLIRLYSDPSNDLRRASRSIRSCSINFFSELLRRRVIIVAKSRHSWLLRNQDWPVLGSSIRMPASSATVTPNGHIFRNRLDTAFPLGCSG